MRMKKLLSVLLVLAMVLSCTGAVFAGSSTDIVNVYKDGTLMKTVTVNELATVIPQVTGANYSAFNTWPTWQLQSNVNGAKIDGILEYAGIQVSSLLPNSTLTFTSSDGYTQTFTKTQLFANRFYYQSETAQTSDTRVYPIISYKTDYSTRLMLGQAFAGEQTYPAFNKNMAGPSTSPARIDVNTTETTAQWDEATPDHIGVVSAGTNIVLTLPNMKDLNDSKIYFTTDGTDPDPVANQSSTQLYNETAYKYWESKPYTPNYPVFSATGTQKLKILIKGFGKLDRIQEYTYRVN